MALPIIRSKEQAATAIAILFHLVGLAGILFFQNRFFIQSTPFIILISFALILWTQKEKNLFFTIFLFTTVVMGFVVEIIGVHTQALFGEYSYGNTLGFKILKVPVLIGINWFIIIYCSGISIHTLLLKAISKIAEQSGKPPLALKALSVIVDGATMAVFFDWIMEPVAVKLGFWKWEDESIPVYNYICWFLVSMALLVVFHFCNFNKQNKFGINLFLIQIMFFLLLRSFL
jgi:putative membrane protein